MSLDSAGKSAKVSKGQHKTMDTRKTNRSHSNFKTCYNFSKYQSCAKDLHVLGLCPVTSCASKTNYLVTMATGITRLSDLVVPAIWYPYFSQLSPKTSAFLQSGIMARSSEYDSMALSNGLSANVPFTRPLIERSSPWKADGTNTTTSEKMVASQMSIPFIKRRHKLGWNQLAAHIAGTTDLVTMGRASWGREVKITPGDTSATLGYLMADLWNEDLQLTLFRILDGCFASTTNTPNLSLGDPSAPGLASQSLDTTIAVGVIGVGNRVSPATLGRAAGLLSDRGNSLSTLAIHPEVYYGNLLPNNITPNQQTSGQDWQIPRYLQYNLILDDTLPVDRTLPAYPKYTNYLFAPGSVCFGDGKLDALTGAEVQRDVDQTEDFLHTRRAYIVQPKGMSYAGGVPASGEGPSDATFAIGANWQRADYTKNIGIVRLVTNG